MRQTVIVAKQVTVQLQENDVFKTQMLTVSASESASGLVTVLQQKTSRAFNTAHI